MPANGDFGAEINGHTGFPNIREIRLNARQSGTRRKVIYLSSVSLSHRKNPGMSMSELVHIDRSQRLAATLARGAGENGEQIRHRRQAYVALRAFDPITAIDFLSAGFHGGGVRAG